jgi:hypothetical protein
MTLLSEAVKMNTTLTCVTSNRQHPKIEQYCTENRERPNPTFTFVNIGDDLHKIVLYYRQGKIGVWDMKTKLLSHVEFNQEQMKKLSNYHIEYWSNQSVITIFTPTSMFVWSTSPLLRQASGEMKRIFGSSTDITSSFDWKLGIECTDIDELAESMFTPRDAKVPMEVNTPLLEYTYQTLDNFDMQKYFSEDKEHVIVGYSKSLNGTVLVRRLDDKLECLLCSLGFDQKAIVTKLYDISIPSQHRKEFYFINSSGDKLYMVVHNDEDQICQIYNCSNIAESHQWDTVDCISYPEHNNYYSHTHITFLRDDLMLISLFRKEYKSSQKSIWFRDYYIRDTVSSIALTDIIHRVTHIGKCVTSVSGGKQRSDGTWDIYLAQQNDVTLKLTLNIEKNTMIESTTTTETYRYYCYNEA